ncbi:MAG: caspase family protein [Desulfobacteria bacterium]
MNKTVSILKILIGFFVIPAFLTPAIASEKPEIFVQLGHTGGVKSVAYSPNGRYALSGSDKTLKLWEISSGREIRTFTGHTRYVNSIAFSPDGGYALSGSLDNSIKLWDIFTGKEIKTFTDKDSVNSVMFSPDGKYFLAGCGYTDMGIKAKDTTVKLWEVSTGQKIRTFTGHTGDVWSVAFSPNGRHAVSAGRLDKTIKLWEISTGGEMRTFAGHTDQVYSVAFSPDGKYVLSGGSDKTVRLWDVSTGNVVKILEGHTNTIFSVAFSPDGRYIVSGGSDGIGLWDISTGNEILVFRGGAQTIAFSPDGKYVVSGTGNVLKLWDLATGREIRTFGGNISAVNSVKFSSDGRYVFSAGNTLSLWDTSSGREIRTFAGNFPVAVSPDGMHVATVLNNKIIKLWSVFTGKETMTFTGHSGRIIDIVFSFDGKFLTSGDDDVGKRNIKLWNINSGKEIKSESWTWSELVSGGISPGGEYALMDETVCAGEHWKKTLNLWDINTGEKIKTLYHFRETGIYTDFIAFSPDRKKALSGYENSFQLWGVETGEKIRDIKILPENPNAKPRSASFSSDGKYAVSGHYDNSIKLWDISTGRRLKTFTGHNAGVLSVSFSPDDRYISSGSWDGTLRIWNVDSNKEVVQMVHFNDGEWIVITPEGYYNSSANGDKHLNVRIGNNVYGIDQYRSVFYKPPIVEAALRLGDTQKAIAEVLGSEKEKPVVATIQNIEPPFIVIKSPEDGKKIDTTNTEISLYVEDRNQTIKSVKVYANGRTVTGEEVRGVKLVGAIPEGKKSLDLKIPVSLDIGENLIEVIAFNGFSEGRKAIRIYSAIEKNLGKGEAILPNLWILSIGINKYQDKNLTPLSYAVADSEGIVEAFNNQKGKLFREIKSLIINDNSSIKPSRDNITDNLDYVKKAGHNDIVLLFIAGHGINDDSGDFYFLPSDAVISEDGSIKKSKAISWRDIKAILDIPAKKLIFADTCHSEGVAGKKTRGVDNDRFVKELQEANAVIFTSSRGRELSQESDKWKHGAFTYAIIEGISGKADLIKDNKISMKELDTYVSETVPQITNGAQHPITNTPDGYVNFPVAVLE